MPRNEEGNPAHSNESPDASGGSGDYPHRDRRKWLRTAQDRPQGLLIGCNAGSAEARMCPANLVNVCEGGLGVEMFVPLVPGSAAPISGELHGPVLCVALHGQARVAHCEPLTGGLYRIGLAFERVRFRNLYCSCRQNLAAPDQEEPVAADTAYASDE